jgi:uncharacterized Zn finger protein
MIQLTPERLTNAIKRARTEAKNLVVRTTRAARMYRVENKSNGNVYTVNFFIGVDGQKYGSCNCRAGQEKMACKHIAAAAALNTYLASQGRFQAQKSVSLIG